jgi:hypothetical protein
LTVIIGFDPGISGAACAISVDDMGGIDFIDLIDLPSCPDGTKRQLHVEPLGSWLEKINPDSAIIENVQPMMGSGSDSQAMRGANSFRFGMACGALRATLAAYRIPIALVTPQVWKRASGLARGSDKEASRQLAIRRLPAAAHLLKRKLDHNRSESVLIALYGIASRLS